MNAPHDKLAKAVFSQLEHARSELSSVLPSAVAECVHWDTLALVSGEFIDAPLERVETDLLYTVRLGSNTACIYVLLEHMSTVEDGMAFRLLRYMTRIWERFHHDSPREPLPVIIPVVLHHSDNGWTAPLRFRELFRISDDLTPALAPFLPDFSYVLDDLSKLDDAALRARAVNEYVRATLLVLQRCRNAADPVAILRPWAATLVAILTAPNGVEALSILTSYILKTCEGRVDELGAFLRELGPKGKEAYMTMAEELEARGEAKGQAKGQATMLLKLLALRFGPVSETVRTTVQAATCEQLESWAERVLSAASLEDVFTG